MAKMYTLTEAQEQLGINPKTFRRWLEKANINPDAQVSHLDNRIKFLTEEQVTKLAHDHGVDIGAPKAKTAESVPPGAYKLLQERLDKQENTIGEIRLKISDSPSRSEVSDLEAQVHSALDLLGKALERLTTLEDQFAEAQETIAFLQASKRPTKAKSEAKSETEAVNTMPEGLISWRTLANLHKMPQTTVRNHIRQGFIPIVEGKWKVGNGYVTEALDAKGQREFWVQYHKKEGFWECDDCPHQVQEISEEQTAL